MVIGCVAKNLRVVSKSVRESNGRAYYNIGVVAPNGSLGEVSADVDVYNGVIPDKSYDFQFDINTAYLRKDYNCSLRMVSFSECSVSDSKNEKGGK